MTTDVKYFHSLMLGAPQVSGLAGSLVAMLDAVLVDGFGLQTISSASVAGGVCTLVTPTAPAAEVGTVVLVAGATPTSLNGEQRVTAVGANSVSFATAEADTTPTGTITVKVAPAGWLKPFSGTNKAAYQIDLVKHPDSPAMLVRVDDTITASARIRGYLTMTGIDTGTSYFPTSTQANPLYVYKSDLTTSEVRRWMVVATDRFVYIGISPLYGDVVNYGPMWFGFGQVKSVKPGDQYNFLVAGNSIYSPATASDGAQNTITSSWPTTSFFLARSYTQLGTSTPAKLRSWPADYGVSGVASVAMGVPYPNPVDDALYLCPVDVAEVNQTTSELAHRGRLPGLLFLPHAVSTQICADGATAYLDSNVPALPGRTVGFMPCAYGAGVWGVAAFDLTGPWEF